MTTATATATRAGTVTGSGQQEAFWAELEAGRSHVLLEARAGTGKSFSCREGMRRLPRGTRSLYSAFNKHVADEFSAGGLPAGATASTMHSVGFSAIREDRRNVRVDERKVESILKDLDAPKKARGALGRLAGLCKGEMLDGSDLASVEALAVKHGLELGSTGGESDEALGLVPAVLGACADRRDVIDYDDMIWHPVVHRLTPRRADVLFVDEAQDLNLCQQRLAGRICPGGRVVVVGDRHQAIYGFRGADTASIPNMERALGSTRRGLVSLPLTVTRRCPRRVVELARGIVPDIEPMPGAPEGLVATTTADRALARLDRSDMVLCRVNSHLVRMAFDLIRDGKRAVIRGRDMSKGLVAMARKIGGATPKELIERIGEYREEKLALLVAAKAKADALVELEDRCDCLVVVASECRTVDEIGPRLQRLFSDDDGDAVTLSSVHRSKGLEADRVYVLRPDLLPHPKASQAWERVQEANLAYVAATRARAELHFIGDIPDIYGR